MGNVYYSEQGAQFGDAEAAGVTRASAGRKFVDFLRNFRGEPQPGRPDGETLYRDRLDTDPPPDTLTVALDDLIAHDGELAAALRKNPAEYLPLVRPPGPAARRCALAAAAARQRGAAASRGNAGRSQRGRGR